MPGGMGGPMPGGMGGPMPGGMGGPTPGGMQLPPEPPLIIEQTESEVRIKRTMFENGKQTPVIVSYKFSEQERVEMIPVPNSPNPVKVVTKLSWKRDKFQVRTTAHLPKGKNEMRRKYSISKDGKVLTVETSNVTSMGEMVQKQVYSKQEQGGPTP
jgi:hypothetical protein